MDLNYLWNVLCNREESCDHVARFEIGCGSWMLFGRNAHVPRGSMDTDTFHPLATIYRVASPATNMGVRFYHSAEIGSVRKKSDPFTLQS